MTYSAGKLSRAEEIFKELGIAIDPQLFELALTHRSWAYEHGQAPHNERLEFLGDAVLQLAVTDYLYRKYPKYPEGKLAKLRAAVVNARACAEVARELELGSLLKLGRGEVSTGGENKTSILADTMEAVIGAVYISCGREKAEALVHRLFDSKVIAAAEDGAGRDYKTSLQELIAHLGLGNLYYEISESGPDHDKRFSAEVIIARQSYGSGTGKSKKRAEQLAAQQAYLTLMAQKPEAAVAETI